MRSTVIRFAALLGLLVAVAGCTDLSTAPNAAKDPIAAGNVGISTSVFLEPVIVRGCDPTITECDDDAGWDSCASSEQGALDPEMGSVESCPGGGGSGAGGDGGSAGSGGGGDGTPSQPVCPDYGCLTPFEEGPFLWAACVLAVLGGTYSVEVVGEKFVGWYDAHKALVSVRRSLDVSLQMQRDGYVIDPAAIELLYYKLEQATRDRDDAVGAVEEATGVSVLTLIAAGLACGAAAAAPTP